MAYPRTAALFLTDTDASIHTKHGSLKTLKQRCGFCLHKQRSVAILKSALECCKANLSGTVLGQSRGNAVKIKAQEVIVNTFKNLIVFLFEKCLSLWSYKSCLNLVPCCAV